MKSEIISDQPDLMIRRLRLEPFEAMVWHTDTCRRFTVVVQGSKLAIEYQDNGEVEEFDVHPGMADWDEPQSRIHRAINRGADAYEEIVTFYRDPAGITPQPETHGAQIVPLDLRNCSFELIENDGGHAEGATIMQFDDSTEPCRAEYRGPNVIYGQVIVHNHTMLYHALTSSGDLNAGCAEISIRLRNELPHMQLSWRWLTGDRSAGVSVWRSIESHRK